MSWSGPTATLSARDDVCSPADSPTKGEFLQFLQSVHEPQPNSIHTAMSDSNPFATPPRLLSSKPAVNSPTGVMKDIDSRRRTLQADLAAVHQSLLHQSRRESEEPENSHTPSPEPSPPEPSRSEPAAATPAAATPAAAAPATPDSPMGASQLQHQQEGTTLLWNRNGIRLYNLIGWSR